VLRGAHAGGGAGEPGGAVRDFDRAVELARRQAARSARAAGRVRTARAGR